MSDIIKGLNERQREAVVTTEGPLMVMAGAGSGKTRVLTHRIAYLINDLGVYPSNILAVTFTNKAAKEMKDRISKLVNFNVNAMWISTFHSFCARFLRKEIFALKKGYTSNFIILDTDDSVKIIKDIIKDKAEFERVKPKELQGIISKFKNTGNLYIDDYYKRRFDELYARYQEELKRLNALDFDDLILYTVNILENDLSVLEYYQQKFQYILVDEYQDTNNIQFKLINLLAGFHRNLFIVGDEDQSIYSFRGAEIKNIRKFMSLYPDYKIIKLEQNYRSTKPILDAANKLITFNTERIAKNLFTENSFSKDIVYHSCETSYEENRYVLNKIKEALRNGNSLDDIAILYRNNVMSRGFEDLFVVENIPYTIYGGLSFYSRKEIKDVISYLRLIVDPNCDLALKRIINEPKRSIGATTLEKLEIEAKANNISMLEAISTVNVNSGTKAKLEDFKKLILSLREDLNGLSMVDFIEHMYNKTGYMQMLIEQKEEERIDNIKELLSVFKEQSDLYSGSNLEVLSEFLNDLALRTDADDDNSSEKVRLMTIHQAKGLEFKIVFVVGLEQGIFPSDRDLDNLDEERRICYVAVTRAMRELYLTSASNRFIYGHSEFLAPSQFIREMGLIKINKIETKSEVKKYESKEAYTTIDKAKVTNDDYAIGEHIIHKIYGEGVIVNIGDNKIMDVAFASPHGVKKILKGHPSISKK